MNLKEIIVQRIVEPLRRRDIQLLLGITILAIVIRSIPAWIFPGWGADLGIYYGITKDFVENPELFQPYSGWGSSYEYFWVLYVVSGGISILTGWDPMLVLQRTAPIFGGLCVPIFYFLALELFGSKRAALIAAAFLAVNPFHIYQTSHAAPHTMGHFFLVLTFYLYIRYRTRPSYYVPLFISGFLLICSHHLGMYFFIISIVFVTFWRNLRSDKWTPKLKHDLVFIIVISTAAFLYWMFVATPVYNTFMKGATGVHPTLIIAAFFVGLAVLFGFVVLWRKFGTSIHWKRPIPREDATKVYGTVLILTLIMAFFSYHHIYGTQFIFDPMASVFLLPTSFICGLAIVGWKYNLFEKKGAFASGWLWVLVLSMMFGVLTNSQTLYSFRHVEYIAYPLSLLAALGAYRIWKNLERPTKGKKMKKRIVDVGNVKAYAVLIVILVLTSTASAYSVQTSTSKAHEEINKPVFQTIEWLEGNISRNQTVATDHRISVILMAEDFNATADDVYFLWYSEDWTDALEELEAGGKDYERVQYVLIDEVMREKSVIVNINESYRPINDTNYEKFQHQPFEPVEEGSFTSPNGKHYSELNRVNWTYIEDNR